MVAVHVESSKGSDGREFSRASENIHDSEYLHLAENPDLAHQHESTEETSTDQIKSKKKKKKKEKAPAGAESVVSQLEGKIDGRKEKKKKKKKREEFRSDGTDLTLRVNEEAEGSKIDNIEKRSCKRERPMEEEDLGKREKRRKRMSKGDSAGLDKEIHEEETIDILHVNLSKKKEKEKDLRDAVSIGSEERKNEENGDDKLEEREEENYEVEKKKKKKRKKEKGGSSSNIEKEINEEEEKTGNIRNREEEKDLKEGSKTNKRAKKASRSEVKGKTKNKEKGDKTSSGNNEEKNNKNEKKRKKVQFSDEVQVFPAPSGSKKKKKDKRETDDHEGLIWGKRFTKEEDAKLLQAIDDYIKVKQLGENGREMVLNSKKHNLRGCWKEIAACLPHRPYYPVYYRARNLLVTNATPWTPEEYEDLRKFQEACGNQWKAFGDLYLKNRHSVKDAWRRTKHEKMKTGNWGQEEYQALFDLVNMDLKLKAFTEEPETHCVLRDNISWEAISDKLETRNQSACCIKWYRQLTSPLVRDDLWADTDDYRLILALQNADATCIEEVEWDYLLPHREGDICRERWQQMVRYIGEHKERSFTEQVDILSKRYCAEMLEYRAKDDGF